MLLAAVAAVLGLTPIWAGAAETPTGALGMLTGAPMQRSLPLIPGAVEPGVRSLGLGSAAGRGPDGVGTGACPLGTNMAGSAAMAPLIPNLNISTSGAGAEQNFGAGPDLAVGPVYGATYGENLGGGPGSVLAQSSAILGLQCPPSLGQGLVTRTAPIVQIPAGPSAQVAPLP